MRRIIACVSLGYLLCFPIGAGADESVDNSSMLPSIRPVEPADAIDTFRVQPGFRIELVASEPLISDPVEIAFDERGRLWVLDFRQYNQEYHGGDMGVRGSLKVLEDTDRDGVMDRATTFIDGLDYSSAFCLWKDGVYLGSTPDIVYLSDTDGDGKADQREVVFTGFAKDSNRAGQAQMNSFRWGFDNRIYVCTNSGGSVKRYDSDQQLPVSVRGRDFTFDPLDRDFDVRSGGGQHGMTLDRWGNQFNCQSSKPCQFVYYDSRYLKNNLFMPAPSPSVLITGPVTEERIFSISSEEPWRIVRSKLRTAGEFRGRADIVDGVVSNHGFFTAASGLTAYCGDAFPEEYCRQTFIGETANNIVYRAELIRDGVGFISRRANPERKAEFVASTDNWFRPVQFANGPDGALYIVDMYREIIEGGAFLPPDVVKNLNMASGDDRGRIYRVLPDAKATQPMPDLSGYSTKQLVALLAHRNGWHRDVAARLLYERQDHGAIDELRRMVATSDFALGRTRARYMLDSFDAYDARLALAALWETDTNALVHGLRLADRIAADSESSTDSSVVDIRDRIVELTRHQSAPVRYQSLFSLSGFSHPDKTSAITQRLLDESDDRWMRLAAICGASNVLAPLFETLYRDADFSETEVAYSSLSELVDIAGRSSDPDMIAKIATILVEKHGNTSKWRASLFRRLLNACSPRARVTLLQSGDEEIVTEFDTLMKTATEIAFDSHRDLKTRVRYLRLLKMADYASVAESLQALLRPDLSDVLQRESLTVLSQFSEPEIGEFLVSTWPRLTPSLRSQAAEALFSRPSWTESALDALEQGTISRGEVGSIRITTLRQHTDPQIAGRAAKLFGDGSSDVTRAEVVRGYRAALDSDGDIASGKTVFKDSCSACHRLENVGKICRTQFVGYRETWS